MPRAIRTKSGRLRRGVARRRIEAAGPGEVIVLDRAPGGPRAHAREFFAAHAGSDLKLTGFAKLHGISVGRVYRWRKKLGITTPRPSSVRKRVPNSGGRPPRSPS